jgi:hypothetical protein
VVILLLLVLVLALALALLLLQVWRSLLRELERRGVFFLHLVTERTKEHQTMKLICWRMTSVIYLLL